MQIELDFYDNKNQQKNIINKGKKFKLASLFSGCGGLDLGFKGGFKHLNGEYLPPLPFEIIFSNDIDKDAISTYNENRKYFNHEILHDDIKNVSPEEIENFDVLTAGFPCQPFSSAGKRKGIEDDRGTLFEEVLRFISIKLPKIVVMENVRGILSSKMEDGSLVTDEIIQRLKKIRCKKHDFSYNISKPMLLNSSNFGVPQNRHRVIIIAVRTDINIIPDISDLLKYSIDYKEDDLKVSSVLKYDKNLPNIDDVWNLSPQALSMVPYIIRSWKDIPYEFLPERLKKIRDDIKRYRSPNFYRRFGLHEINGTITASAQPENCGILHPIEHRRYNVREIARIQSFPDDFTFNSPDMVNKYKVIGNAVPPVMAYAIARWCMEALIQNSNVE